MNRASLPLPPMPKSRGYFVSKKIDKEIDIDVEIFVLSSIRSISTPEQKERLIKLKSIKKNA